jgi:aromatase
MHTDNSVIIKAPLGLVWDVTNDVERWGSLFTEYQSVQVLAREDNTIRFRLTMYPDAAGRVWSWVSERTLDPDARVVKARRIEPGPFEFMHIEWTYEEVPGGTRMRWLQHFRMKPQAPANDDQMAAHINANSRTQMAVIKAHLEEAAEASLAWTCLREGAD